MTRFSFSQFHLPQRLLSLVLALVMLFSLLPTAAFAAENENMDLTPVTDPTGSSSEEEELTDLPADDPASEDNVEEQPAEGTDSETQLPAEDTEAGSEDESIEDADPDADSDADNPSESETEEDSAAEDQLPDDSSADDPVLPDAEPAIEIAETYDLALDYDDRYSFDQEYEGYEIIQIQTEQVTSYQVSGGKKTSTLDENVLVADGDSAVDVIASGVGTATVLLALSQEADLARELLAAQADDADAEAESDAVSASEDALSESLPTEAVSGDATSTSLSEQESPALEDSADDDSASADTPTDTEPVQETVSLIQVNVTVSPARLTLFFLAGQSNMEGYCGTSYRYQDSVLCKEGQVYSTYAPKDDFAARRVTGISSLTGCTTSNASSFVPSSLTVSASLAGTTLLYPLNSLTEGGKGKTGPDAALAYQWNLLTGDKVWVINAAVGSSSISTWVSGGECYQRANAVFTKCLNVYDAELASGHYTSGNRILYWLQGESDKDTSCSSYIQSFKSMRSGFTGTCKIEYIGMIAPRAYQEPYTTNDINLNGPRIAQYYIANNPNYPNVYMVSNINEQWISDSGTAQYFSSAYPEGSVSYPLRSSSSISSLPTRASQTHDGIHYTQIAHNENGLDAADNMYHAIYGGETNVTVTWRDRRYTNLSTLTISPSQSELVVPVIYPLYRSKDVSYALSSSKFSYDPSSGKLTAPSSGSATMKATINGSTVSTLNLTASYNAAPVLTSISNTLSGIKISWNKVSGASKYEVYRKAEDGKWSLIKTTTSTSYTDTAVQDSATYTYTIRSIRKGVRSQYDSNGLSICYLSPVKCSTANVDGGIRITWAPSGIAPKYNLYRKTGTGTWELIAVFSSQYTTYLDRTATSGITYSYCVRKCYGVSMSATSSSSIYHLSAPELSYANNGNGCVTVGWKPVSGATGYVIYRKTSTSGWSKLCTVSGGSTRSYADRTVSNNNTYIYTVRASKGSTTSYFKAAGVTAAYLAPPVIYSIRNLPEGIQLSWHTVAGATGYQVYRKTDSTSWVLVDTITDSSTSYLDTSTLASGSTYIYTLRALNDTARSYFNGGRSLLRLDTPILTSVGNSTSSTTLHWQKVAGATGYVIYRKTPTTGWSKLASVSGGSAQSYVDKSVVSGTTYTYTVRASKGSVTSYFDVNGLTITFLVPPTMTGASNAAGGIKISWQPLDGATGYRIYRKSPSAGWILIDTVEGGSNTSYLDITDLVSGTSYTYAIRALSGSSVSYFKLGKTITYMEAPSSIVTKNVPDGIEVTWNQVDAATGYMVYRRTDTAGWTLLATIQGGSNTLWKDTSALVEGETYTYTVRAKSGTLTSFFYPGAAIVRDSTTPELPY